MNDDEKLPWPDPGLQMAAERTLLAWVRTGLALMGFGFVVARFGLFLRELAAVKGEAHNYGVGGSVMFGVTLVGVGIWLFVVAGLRYRCYSRDLKLGRPPAAPGPMFGLSLVTLLAGVGVAMAIYLLGFG